MVLGGTDKILWRKNRKNECHCYVVIETYDNVKNLLQRIVKAGREENSSIVSLFEEIDASLSIEKFMKKYIMSEFFTYIVGSISSFLEIKVGLFESPWLDGKVGSIQSSPLQ